MISSVTSFTRYVATRYLQAIVFASIVLIVLYTQISNSFILGTINTSRDSRASQLFQFEHVFGTKTKYWDQREGVDRMNNGLDLSRFDDTSNWDPLQQELKLIQTQIVARHGTRYPTSENINEIEDLLSRLKPYEKALPKWMQNFTLPYNLSVENELADAGQREIREFGARSLFRSGHDQAQTYSKEKYRLVHTYVTRTRDSAIAFASAYFANAKAVRYIKYPRNKDLLLRFFDQCARYQHEIKHNQTAQEQFYMFHTTSVMAKNVQWLKQSLGLTNEKIALTTEDAISVQTACAFDIALYHNKHHWCTLLSDAFVHSLEYLDDIKQFYWIGGGYKINYEMSAVLLREIFATMEAKARGDSALRGIFFFAHAETTLPLMTLLGYGDRSPLLSNATDTAITSRGFRTSILSPFAANLQFRLFETKTTHDFFVQILVNEKEIPIPGCGRVFCKLSKLEQIWHYYLKTYDFHADCNT